MRIGIDLGGTKIAGVVLDGGCVELAGARISTPADGYEPTVAAVVRMVRDLEATINQQNLPVGIGHPGVLAPDSGLIRNANLTCLNNSPLQRDLATALGRPVAMANDANCLAASELQGGAAESASPVFAVILGTGVGGALAVDGHVIGGAQAIAGEWGHNPLPWQRPDWQESPGPACWCGKQGCIETWLSGPGLAAEYARRCGQPRETRAIVQLAEAGDSGAAECMRRYEHRLARGLAAVINLMDPEVIVLGGGLSRIERLYENVPALWAQWVFGHRVQTRLLPAQFGDASGVRGAAMLAG